MNSMLPQGFFSLPVRAGFSTSHVYSLIKISEDLYRQVTIITDLPVERDINAPDMVRLNPKLKEELFDYLFICGEKDEAAALYEKYRKNFDARSWTCWMPKRMEEIEFDQALESAKRIISEIGYSCVCVPNVAVRIGPLRDMFIDAAGPTTSVMTPNTGDGFWREVFRTSGFYGANARMSIQR